MMMRWLIGVCVLLNLALLAWTLGGLERFGLAPLGAVTPSAPAPLPAQHLDRLTFRVLP
jgi:hypothetical protein